MGILLEEDLGDAGALKLIVDGEVLSDVRCHKILQEHRVVCSLSDGVSAEKLLKYSAGELGPIFENITVNLDGEFQDMGVTISFDLFDHGFDKKYETWFFVRLDPLNWKKGWSASEFVEKVSALSHGQFDVKSDGQFVDFTYANEGTDLSFPMSKVICDKSRAFQDIVKEAVYVLGLAGDSDGLRCVFDIPREMQSACGQYLMYFSQFLRDLGIDADATVKEEARKILFTVAPSDGAVALEAVQRALSIYLDLPRAQGGAIMQVAPQNIAVAQLQAQVFHFCSQLKLAEGGLLAKQSIIDAQQVAINALELAVENLKTTKNVTESKVEFFGGIVKLATLKRSGFEVDLPKLLDRLRRR